jgi:hypothetical protein
MTGRGPGPRRVRLGHVERLAETLSVRDLAILQTLERVRLASGVQLERLHFNNLSGRSRTVMRWRVLKHLTDERLLLTLHRPIGTARRGSGQLRYGLDSAGLRLIRLHANREPSAERVRRPRLPGERFVAHTLAVTELYVGLVASGQAQIDRFQTEGAAYWPDGLGGWLKPDAFIKVSRDGVADYWWYEADMPRHDSDLANESLPVIERKLRTYLDFVSRGQLGPDGIVPRVLFGVPTAQRQTAIQAAIEHLPEPAADLFVVADMAKVSDVIIAELQKE